MTSTESGPKLPHLPHQADVFHSATEGYHTIRVPTVATAADASIVIVSEARRYNNHDPGFQENEIHLVCKRSTDDGVTWSPLALVENPGERWAVCNPTLLLDRDTERLAAFEPWAAAIHSVTEPSVHNPAGGKLAFSNLGRPVYPLDDI